MSSLGQDEAWAIEDNLTSSGRRRTPKTRWRRIKSKMTKMTGIRRSKKGEKVKKKKNRRKKKEGKNIENCYQLYTKRMYSSSVLQ